MKIELALAVVLVVIAAVMWVVVAIYNVDDSDNELSALSDFNNRLFLYTAIPLDEPVGILTINCCQKGSAIFKEAGPSRTTFKLIYF